jgi:hypothetical protein
MGRDTGHACHRQAVTVQPPAGGLGSRRGAIPALDSDALNRSLVTWLAGVEDDLLDVGPRDQYRRATARSQPIVLSAEQDARMVGPKGELAPSERHHGRDDQDDADHQEDRLCVPEEPQADGQEARRPAAKPRASRPVTRSRSS